MPSPQDLISTEPSGLGSGRAGVLAAVPLLLLVALGCSEPDPLPMRDLVRRGDAYLHPVTLEPYSGPVFKTFEGQPLRIERRASLREGHYDGPYEWYFDNRQLSAREIYRDGQRNGPYEWYFKSGRLYERGTYGNGALEGPYEAYYETGQLYEKGTYRAGEFDGPREWYLEGHLIELVTYVDGRIDGPYKRYTTDGELDLSGILRDGDACGTWLEGKARITYPSCAYTSD